MAKKRRKKGRSEAVAAGVGGGDNTETSRKLVWVCDLCLGSPARRPRVPVYDGYRVLGLPTDASQSRKLPAVLVSLYERLTVRLALALALALASRGRRRNQALFCRVDNEDLDCLRGIFKDLLKTKRSEVDERPQFLEYSMNI